MSPARLARAANMPKAPTPSAITSSGMPSTGAPQTKAAPVARASRTNSASVRGPMGAGLPWGLRVKRGRGSGDSAAAGGLVLETSERVVLGGSGLAREVHQVAHLADALHMLRAANEHLDLVLGLHLAAKEHHAVLGIHAHAALGSVLRAEDHALDLARESGVHERVATRAGARGASRHAGGGAGRVARPLVELTPRRSRAREQLVARPSASCAAAVGVKDIGRRRPGGARECGQSGFADDGHGRPPWLVSPATRLPSAKRAKPPL